MGNWVISRFNGTYEYSIDSKGRINIPAKFRKALATSGSDTLFIRKAPNNSLWVYPQDVWEKEALKLEDMGNSKASLDYRRRVYRSLSDSTIDGQGRISITAKQLAFANIDKKAVLVGMGNYIEIVHPDSLEDDDEDFDDLYFSAVSEGGINE